MVPRLITLAPEMSIHEAIHVLLDANISGAPVVDREGDLIGMLSKKDCLRIIFSSKYHADRGGPVSEYMSTPVETLDASMDLVATVQHFLSSHFRRFPVLEDGKLVGQVSRVDLLRELAE